MKTFGEHRKLALGSVAWMLILFVTTSWCQSPDSPRFKDTVFVEQTGQKGSYRPVAGDIKELTSSRVIIRMLDGEIVLYTREVVEQVRIDATRAIMDASHYPQWRNLIDAHWNPDVSQLVRIARETPLLGDLFKDLLATLPSGVDTVAALIILFLALCYALYWAYDFVLVSRRAKTLDREKLAMEVAKLRYEIAGLKKQLGVLETVAYEPEAAAEDVEKPIRQDLRVHQVDVVAFLKHKVLRVLSDEQKRNRTEEWRRTWQRYAQRKRWVPSTVYFIRLAVNYLLTVFTAIFFVSWTVDIFLVSSFTPSGEADIMLSLVFLLLSVASLAFLLRLNTQRMIMQSTYNETLSSAS